MSKKLKVSFVYPMYNEIGNIEKVIRSTHALGVKMLEDFEILVVDDCSADGCGALADRLGEEFMEVRVIHHEQNRKLGWIYSRTKTLPDDDYQALLGRFRDLGYDTSGFVKFVQTPDQIGQPGVWSDGIK